MADVVGVVAVHVVADAQGMDKDVEKAAEEAGGEGGERFTKAWNKHMDKVDYFAAMRKRAEEDVRAVTSDIDRQLRKGVKPVDITFNLDNPEEIGKFADALRTTFGKELTSNVDRDLIEAYSKAMKALVREQEKSINERLRLEERAAKEMSRLHAAAIAEDRRRTARLDAQESKRRRANMLAEAYMMNKVFDSVGKRIDMMRSGKIKIDIDDDTLRGKISRLARAFRGIGGRGRGGLSLALRGMGQLLSLTTLAGRAFLVLGELAAEALKTIAQGIRSAVSGMEGLGKNLGTVAAAFIQAAASGVGLITLVVALAVAFSVLVVSIGVIVAAISMLTGLLVTAGAGLAYAAAGALVLGPALAAVGVAVGTVALGMQGVTGAVGAFNKVLDASDPKERAKAWKAYEEALSKLSQSARDTVRATEPLVEQFRGIRSQVQEHLFAGLADDMGKLKPLLDVVGGGLTQMADAVNRVVTYFINLFTEGRNLEILGQLFAGLAGIAESLGKAFGQFLMGIIGFFNAVAPTAQRFADALQDGATRFSEWANSARGQNAIKDFMDKAWEALKTVWDIVVVLAQAFGALFSGAQEEGKGFLDKVLEIATEFRDWIEEVKNSGTLDTWLGDAKTFGKGLLDVIGKVVALFDALDTSATRTALNILIGVITGIIKTITGIVDAISFVWGLVSDIIGAIPGVVGAVESAIASAFGAVVGFLGNVGSAIGSALGTVAGAIGSVIGAIGDVIGGIVGVIGSVLGAVGGVIASIAEAVAGFFRGVVGVVTEILQPFISIFSGVFDLITSLISTAFQLVVITIQAAWLTLQPIFEMIFGAARAIFDAVMTVIVGFVQAVVAVFQGIWDLIWPVLEAIGRGIADVFGWVVDLATGVAATIGTVIGGLVDVLQFLWDKISTAVGSVVDVITDLWDTFFGWIGDAASAAFDGLKSAIQGVSDFFGSVIDGIKGFFEGLWDTVKKIADWIGDKLSWIGGLIDKVPGFVKGIIPGLAKGGLVLGPTQVLVGEAGPEAVIPLARPLSMIDPSVRGMAARLRGEGSGNGAALVGGKVINADITVNSPSSDPAMVATQVVNRLAAVVGA